MAIDFEKKADELCESVTKFSSDLVTELWLRQFAAEVLREEVSTMSRYDVTGTAERYLERRAREIEGGE